MLIKLNSDDLQDRTIAYIGVDDTIKMLNTLYAVKYLDEQNVKIIQHKNISAMIEEARGDINLKDYTNHCMLHELHHTVFGKPPYSLPELIQEELGNRQALKKVYEQLVKGTTNPERKSAYSQLIKQLKEEIEEVPTIYSKLYSQQNVEGQIAALSRNKNTEGLEAVLESCAKEGMNKEEARMYATKILKYLTKNTEDKSDKGDKSDYKSKLQNGKSESPESKDVEKEDNSSKGTGGEEKGASSDATKEGDGDGGDTSLGEVE